MTALLVVVAVVATASSAEGLRRRLWAARAARQLKSGPGPVTVPEWYGRLVAEWGLGPQQVVSSWPWFVRSAALAVMVALWWFPAVVASAATVGVLGAVASRRWRDQAQARRFGPDLAEVIDRVVAELAAGASLPVAFEAGGQLDSDAAAGLATAVARHRRGQAMQSALDRWAGSPPRPEARLVADAVALAHDTGGSRRAALEGVASTLRERQALGDEIRALSTQAQASAVVLVVTPVAFGVAMALADHRVARFLFTTPPGWGCLVGGALLDGVGGLWMARATRRASC